MYEWGASNTLGKLFGDGKAKTRIIARDDLRLVSSEFSATTVNQAKIINFESVSFISNDGNTDLEISFESPYGNSVSANVKTGVILKSGETMSDININVKEIQFRAKSGTCNFRVVGYMQK